MYHPFQVLNLHMLNLQQRSSTASFTAALPSHSRWPSGGIGLTSAALVVPAASYVAPSLCEFLNWYCAYATLWGGFALHGLSWLSGGTSSAVAAAHAFPSISHAFDHAITTLTKWQFHGSLADITKQTLPDSHHPAHEGAHFP
jgi:hypothetical protein